MHLSSAAFKDGGVIPAKYTCSGQDVSPPLNWSGIPGGTRNLALTVIDPDAPGQPFVHWIIFNLPGETVGLAEGEIHTGSRQGRNGFGSIGYRGPCPPRGAPHHYHFKLYALSDPLLLSDGVSAADFEQAIKGMALDTTELVGTFGR